MASDVDVAVRESHVPLRSSGRGARRWAHDAAGVVNFRAVDEAEGNGDFGLRRVEQFFYADGRTSAAEPRRLYLTAQSTTVVIGVIKVKIKDAMSRALAGRERGADPAAGFRPGLYMYSAVAQ